MSNELVVIEEKQALAILSSKDGVEKLIEDVRQRVMSMEGGSLETGVGRAKIKSNAFKATKAKTAIDKEFIQPLIDKVTAKIQPDLDTIQSLKDNKKVLNAGLDQIRKDVNAEVTAIEDEIKRVEEEKAAIEEAKRVAEEIDRDHEFAILMNAEFDREAEDKAAEAKRIEDERLAKEESDRIARENEIRIEAEKAAKAQAEKEKAQLVIDNAHSEALLINRDIDDAAKEAQRVIDEAKAKEKHLADIEAAKQEEIQRQKDEEAKRIADEADRLANVEHATKIMTQTKESIMALGVDEETAKKVTLALKNGEIANVGRIKF